jgi:hypothetical protein
MDKNLSEMSPEDLLKAIRQNSFEIGYDCGQHENNIKQDYSLDKEFLQRIRRCI